MKDYSAEIAKAVKKILEEDNWDYSFKQDQSSLSRPELFSLNLHLSFGETKDNQTTFQSFLR